MLGVERFVNISTDKAANPTSVLGYSKRVAERLTAFVAQEVSGSYLSVRFGNVLGSRGEVLILDLGEPVRIADVAQQLAHLATLPDDSELTLAGSQAERLG